jgi:hypothetical protein
LLSFEEFSKVEDGLFDNNVPYVVFETDTLDEDEL